MTLFTCRFRTRRGEINFKQCLILAGLIVLPIAIYLFFIADDKARGYKDRARHADKLDWVCDSCGKITEMSPRDFHKKHADEFAELDAQNIGAGNMRTHCKHCDARFAAKMMPRVAGQKKASADDLAAFQAAVGQGSRGSGPTAALSGGSGRSTRSGGGSSAAIANGGIPSTGSSGNQRAGGDSSRSANSSFKTSDGRTVTSHSKRGLNFKCVNCAHEFQLDPVALAKTMANRQEQVSEADAGKVPCPSCQHPSSGVLTGGAGPSGKRRDRGF